MKGDPIPLEDHIVRYCRGGAVAPDGSIDGSAFRLRPGDDYLSVNWLECLRLSDRDSELREIRRVLASKLTLGSKAKLATLNVGTLCTHVRAMGDTSLSVTHEPVAYDPSHSGIHGLVPDDDEVADLIAQLIEDSFPARQR